MILDGGKSCGICGGQMVYIRGRYPHTECKRLVCPTCAVERLEQIREIAAPDYGQAFEVKRAPKLKAKGKNNG